MFSTIYIIVYCSALFLGIGAGFLFKFLVKRKNQNKILDYQKEIFRSHSRILMLEGLNNDLELKLTEYTKNPHRISA